MGDGIRNPFEMTIGHTDEPSVLFFLNVDPRILKDGAFRPGTTQALLAKHGLRPHRFVFELTETGAIHDIDDLRGLMDHYQRQGLQIARGRSRRLQSIRGASRDSHVGAFSTPIASPNA